MREALFRGKRIADDKWTYGYLFKCWGRCYLLWGMNGDNPIKEEVYPETVGQFIGLTDKNGKKVFEGDIIKDKEVRQIYMIGYNEDLMKYAFLYYHKELKNIYCGGFVSKTDGKSIEVIGNIHDNPELLEAKE